MQYREISQYDYHLPEELIRKEGVEPRDSAKLFVYDTKTDTVIHDVFLNLAKYLPAHSLLVLNDTKVVPARLHLTKETGGKIEVFVLANEISSAAKGLNQDPGFLDSGSATGMTNEEIPVLVDRRCEIGWKLFFPNGDFFEVTRQEENRFFVRLVGEKNLKDLLEKFGETPIPPYLEENSSILQERREEKLRERYQTIFAHNGNSVAAPTAALHFTDRVFESLQEKNIEHISVTLDVGLGTFAPLREENFKEKKLHSEWIEVSKETAQKINDAKEKGSQIIPVGTTALRTLESCSKNGSVEQFSGKTDIFISPPYRFQIADALITNFHLPKSSLMLLVDAFLQDKGAKRNLIQLYKEAIKEKYAFYSFGDSMLIL